MIFVMDRGEAHRGQPDRYLLHISQRGTPPTGRGAAVKWHGESMREARDEIVRLRELDGRRGHA